MSAAPDLAWEGGGTARLVALAGDAITLESSAPHPPGARPVGKLGGEPGKQVRLKVHACRATPGGAYRIEGRLLDATRAIRAELALRLPSS